MSNTEADLDLEKLFLPGWAKESTPADRFAHYTGEEVSQPDRRGGRRGDRPDRRGGGGPPRGHDRPPGQGRPPRRDQERGGGPRFGGDDRRGRPGQRPFDRRREEERQPEIPLPEVRVTLTVDDKGADTLARQIRITGRAYPMFDIAFMILQKPERFQVVFDVVKKPDGAIAQPLYLCALDDTLWLNEDEAVEHVLHRHFNTFYQAERTQTQPPKGVYTFVAQCGFTGTVLGPPNYHGYQEQLRKLHAERFSRMPFEAYKSRVRIVRDEAIVKKWIEDQSWKTEYICLNVPEAPRLANRESLAQHFRETHLANVIRTVETHSVNGAVARNFRCQGLLRLARLVVEEQRRFPLKLVHNLSQLFAARGLQFFKRDKAVIHVAVARPSYLDLETSVVSDGVRRIIEYINANPKCTRPKLIKALAPSPAPAAPAPAPIVEPAATPAPAAAPAAEGAQTEAAATEAPPSPAPAAAPAPAPVEELTPEQMTVVSDLHWLVHQGHVLELANGTLETAKKPLPRPPKPAPAPAAPAKETATAPAEPIAAEAAPVTATDTPAEPAVAVSETPAPEAVPQAASEPPTEQPAPGM